MNDEIKCKASHLNRAFKKLIIISVILCTLIFLEFNMDLSFRYLLSVIFVFTGLLIVFFLNKYEIEKINLQDEIIELTYFNKIFFKKKPYSCKKQDVKTKMHKNIIVLYKANHIIGRIHNNSVCNEDWIKLKSYFAL
jgi:hypothetical protein